MKKLVNKIFLIPILFVFFSLIVFGVFYFFFVEDLSKKEFEKAKALVLQNEKRILKNNMESIIDGVDIIRGLGYSLIEDSLNELLKILHKHLQHYKGDVKHFFVSHYTDNLFFYIISKDLVYPSIYQKYIKISNKKFLITVYNNHEYLSVEKNYNGVILGVAFKRDLIEKIIKKEIINYIKDVNEKNPLAYIAVGKVYSWDKKAGNFGEIIYHPNKKLIGEKLSMDVSDIKGYFYQREAYKALRLKDSYFLTYYYKNPQTQEYEKKISYFRLYRPYNWIFMRGVYFSQVTKNIKAIHDDILKDIKELFIGTMALLLVFVVVSFALSYMISKNIMNKLINEYERIKKGYENSKKELLKRYYYDQLTSLPNRNKLKEDIHSFNSLILVDIDDFSDLNDIYGFEFGDNVLVYMKEALLKLYSNVYRIGSDEFAILLKREVYENELKRIVKRKYIYKNIKLSVTVGASNIKERLLETAESALKVALKDNSKKYMLYDETFINAQREKVEKLQILYEVLEKKSVVPYYQCIVDRFGKVVKYEALMRIIHNNEVYSPYFFMQLMKETKLYDSFSKIMIEKVFEDISKFNVPISLNLSFEDIANRETRRLIKKLLDKKEEDKIIVFEILESESILDFDLVVDFIRQVKKKNVKIAIDDFGSGYSNFVNVLQLLPDFIKIDASLVKNLENEKHKEIVRLIVDFAKRFKIKTTAEFVANETIFKELLEIEVDEYQGYYFCEPKPIEEIKG
ncbi:MAG: EAL domain-containing protein [Epsilonproteobacteria bacterium]|nr:EAL domain-containing protein [Campylobacterota bacterium]